MRVAVIGASANPKKYGNKAVRAYFSKNHTVYPVNPREKTIEGIRCYRTVSEIPGEVDVALIYVPPEIGLGLLEDIAEKGIRTVYFNPGTENQEIIKKTETLGITPILACAIKAIGLLPGEFP